MIIFAHRCTGFGKEENSLAAVRAAVRQKFSVEIDLRMKRGRIILSHDSPKEIASSIEFDKLLMTIKKNTDILFALHLKEDSEFFFKKISKSANGIKNLFLFVTDFPQDKCIKKMSKSLNKTNLSLYVTSKNLDPDLIARVDYLWLDETKKNIYKDLRYFSSFKKKIICCSPELFSQKYIESDLECFKHIVRDNNIFGLCTDFPNQFNFI